jgi:N-acetylneuraminic acid mutarotase
LNSKAPELYSSSIKYDKGNLYIYGGSQILLRNILFDVIRYKIDNDSWDLINIGNRPGTIAFYAAVIYQDNLYTIFGIEPAFNQSYSIYKLDLTLQPPVWEALTISSDILINRGSQAYAINQGKVYLFGGTANNSEFNDLMLLDLNTNSLQVLSENRSVPTSRMGHGLEIYNEEIYVIGGRNKYSNK